MVWDVLCELSPVHLGKHPAVIVLGETKSGCPGISLLLEPDYCLGQGEVRLDKAEEELPLAIQNQSQVPMSLTVMMVWCLDQLVVKVNLPREVSAPSADYIVSRAT